MKFFLLINNNRWHFNICEQEKNSILRISEPEKAEFCDIFILMSIWNFMFAESSMKKVL